MHCCRIDVGFDVCTFDDRWLGTLKLVMSEVHDACRIGQGSALEMWWFVTTTISYTIGLSEVIQYNAYSSVLELESGA